MGDFEDFAVWQVSSGVSVAFIFLGLKLLFIV